MARLISEQARSKAAMYNQRYYQKHKERRRASVYAHTQKRLAAGLCRYCDSPLAERSKWYCEDHLERAANYEFERRGKRAPEKRRKAIFGKQAAFMLVVLQKQFGSRWEEVEAWCTANIALWVDKQDWLLYNCLSLDTIEAGNNQVEAEGDICQ